MDLWLWRWTTPHRCIREENAATWSVTIAPTGAQPEHQELPQTTGAGLLQPHDCIKSIWPNIWNRSILTRSANLRPSEVNQPELGGACQRNTMRCSSQQTHARCLQSHSTEVKGPQGRRRSTSLNYINRKGFSFQLQWDTVFLHTARNSHARS